MVRIHRANGLSGGLGSPALAVAASGGLSLATLGISAGITAAAMGVQQLIAMKRYRGQQKIGATNRANEAEYHLQANLDAWERSWKTRAEQEVALATFDQGWGWVISANGCGDPNLGSAGQRCISERGPGAVQFPWFQWYRDPIANDPDVTENPTFSTSGFVGDIAQGLGFDKVGIGPGMLLLGGAALLLLALAGD